MPFEKGHKHSQGPRGPRKKSKNSISRYYPKQWDKSARTLNLDIDEVDYRLYNDLPLDDIIDEILNKHKHYKKREK